MVEGLDGYNPVRLIESPRPSCGCTCNCRRLDTLPPPSDVREADKRIRPPLLPPA